MCVDREINRECNDPLFVFVCLPFLDPDFIYYSRFFIFFSIIELLIFIIVKLKNRPTENDSINYQ